MKLDGANKLQALGDASFRLDDSVAAKADFEEALKLITAVFKQFPEIGVKWRLARADIQSGDFYLRTRDPARAGVLYREAGKFAAELVAADTKNFQFNWDLGFVHYRLGQHALRTNDPAAKKHSEDCRKVREKLLAQDEANEKRQMEVMLVLAQCGQHEEAATMAAGLEQKVKPDSEFMVDLGHPFARCSVTVSDISLKARYIAEAFRALRKAIDLGIATSHT